MVDEILYKADYAMSMQTVIVGDERCQFVYRSGNPLRNFREDVKYGAVALTFASDKDKLKGTCSLVYDFVLYSLMPLNWMTAKIVTVHNGSLQIVPYFRIR